MVSEENARKEEKRRNKKYLILFQLYSSIE